MAKTDKMIYLMLILVVTGWGFNVVFVKYLTLYVPPILVASFRMILAGVVLLPFVWKKYGFYKPNAYEWLFLFLIALTGVYGHHLLMAYGIVTTTAINSVLILALNPLMTAFLAAIFIGERFTLKLLIGILLGFSGVVLVVTSGSSEGFTGLSGWGDGILFLSMLGYVLGSLFVKKISVSQIPILAVTAYSTTIGGVLLHLTTVIFYGPSIYFEMDHTVEIWLIFLFTAWIATSLGNLGWNVGIKVLGANRTAMFLNGLPFAGMVASVIILQETIGWVHVVAFILTTLGVVIGISKQKDKAHIRG